MGNAPGRARNRGAGWVIGQLALGAVVVVVGLAGPGWPAPVWPFAEVGGMALGAAGAALFVAGIRALGRSLTPYPAPKDGATLKEGGAFRSVRHPIYAGLLLASAGWSLLTSPLALPAAAVLALFLDRKARREETWLIERYAGYAAYRERVRWRFVPGIR